MPITNADVSSADRKVTALLRRAAEAEAGELRAILAELERLQADVSKIAASGDVFGVQVSKVQTRMSALSANVAQLLDASVPSAAARGVALSDAASAGVKVAASLDVDVVTGPLAAAKQAVGKHLADLQARVVYQLSRMTGEAPAPLGAVLEAIGSKLRGSQVFGAPAAYTAGLVRTTLGDVTGAATSARAVQIEAAGGPRTLKRWVHATGERDPRDSHLAAAQRYAAGIPWDQKFEVGSYRTLRPRSDGLPGTHRFGCRCQVAPVLVTDQEAS